MKKILLILIVWLLFLNINSFANCDDDTCIIDPNILIKSEKEQKEKDKEEEKTIIDNDYVFSIPKEEELSEIDYYMVGLEKDKVKTRIKNVDSPELQRIMGLSKEEKNKIAIEEQERELEIKNNSNIEENIEKKEEKSSLIYVLFPLSFILIWAIVYFFYKNNKLKH